MNYLWVALGGALGSVLRYLAQKQINNFFVSAFPWGTFGVNILGSGIIGLLAAYFESKTTLINLRLFLMIGILGGFTTFSSFSLENMNLLRTGMFRYALSNILLSNIISLAFTFGGYFLGKAYLFNLKS